MSAFVDRFFVALQYPEYRRLWTANASGQAAAWALIVIRGWLVFEETHSSFWVGAATFAAMGPQFIIPPIAGVLADRIDRRTILTWTYTVNLAHNSVLFALAIAGVLDVWMLVALSFVNGVARATQMPTGQALSASLVPREHLLNALSLSAATMQGSRLIGPGIVTPLLAVAGAPAAFLVCTGLYAVGWWQIIRMRPRPPALEKQSESILANFTGGLRYVYERPLLRFIIGLAVFHCGLTMAFESLLPAFSHERLAMGTQGFGTLMMAVGAGALVASIFVSGIRTSKARGNLLLVMAVVSGLGQVVLSLTTDVVAAIGAAALMGGAQAAFMTMAQAVTQSIAVDEFRGRVASINSFSLGGTMAIVNLVNGSVAGSFGSQNLLLFEGLAFVLIVFASFLLVTGRHAYGRAAAVGAAA